MTDSDSISLFRSQVIERTINIEWIVNGIICQHYFGKVLLSFLLEVLYDEYFSFGLRRRILEKVVPDLDKQQLQNLNRVNKIRNYFAHCNQMIVEGSDPTSEDAVGKVIDPRNLDRAIDFERIHTEFMKIIGPLEKYLAEVYTGMGGDLESSEDFKS